MYIIWSRVFISAYGMEMTRGYSFIDMTLESKVKGLKIRKICRNFTLRNASSSFIFDKGSSYAVKWLLMVCVIKQSFHIANMTLESRSHILQTYLHFIMQIRLTWLRSSYWHTICKGLEIWIDLRVKDQYQIFLNMSYCSKLVFLFHFFDRGCSYLTQ